MHRIGGQAGLSERLLHQRSQRPVRFNRLGAAAQNTGVATFDRQRGRFNRDVGPAFINHAEHANGHTHLADADAAGLLFHANDLADHVGHGRKLLASKGDSFQGFRVELEPVQHGAGQAGRCRALQIEGIGGLQRRDLAAQQGSQPRKCFVFDS